MKYTELFFVRGDDAEDYLIQIEVFGEESVVKYIIDDLEECDFEVSNTEPWGDMDTLYRTEVNGVRYILWYSDRYGYVGLAKVEEEDK